MCLRVHARLAVHYLCAYLDLLCTCKLHAYVTYTCMHTSRRDWTTGSERRA